MLTKYKTLLQNPVYIHMLPFGTVMITTEQKASLQSSWPSTNISQDFVRDNLSYDWKCQQVKQKNIQKIVEFDNVPIKFNSRISPS